MNKALSLLLLSACLLSAATLARPIRGASAASSEEFPDLELPYDAEVEYLQSTGTEWIDTGYRPVPKTTAFEISFTKDTANQCFVFGARDNNAGQSISSCTAYSDRTYIRMDWAASLSIFSMTLGYPNLYSAYDNIVSFNGEIAQGTEERSQTRLAYNFLLFTVNTGGAVDQRMLIGKVFYAKIWDNGFLVRDYIPVRFTNELGEWEGAMYDFVSGELFRNSGTGSFVIGPDL